jgi:hypothetical protein
MHRLVLGFWGFTLACGGGADQAGGGQEQAAASAAAAPAGGATITGTVSFTGTPPQNPVIDMSEEPTCKAKYTEPPRDPVVVVSDGKLANVFVRVTSGLATGASYRTPQTPVALDQSGCLYHPRVLGVIASQEIQIRNGDAVLHNIKAVPTANRGFNISQPTQGMASSRTFSQPEVAIPVECSVHSWMHARVFVMEHPYFATSGTDGSFRITGLPAGTYTLEAWHETLGTRTATVTVTDGGTATVSLAFGA